MAQTSSAGDASGSAASDGDIVVTANKREQKLNDVGLAVAVVGGQALRNQRISSLADIAQSVPGLSFTPTPNSTPVYTLRGIGFYETSLGAYPTVPVYIDEFPLSFPGTTSHSAFDLEQVEVLKGPQGTLFGQNATGGAINYIAAKPTSTFKAGVDVGYGRFNAVEAEGFVSGPLAQNLTARFAGRYERADGWQTSNSRPGDHNGKKEVFAGRMLFDLQPADGLRFQLNLNGWKEKGETQAPQYVALIAQHAPSPPVDASPFSPLKPRAADWTPGTPYKNNHMVQAALRTDVGITDEVTLTSLTSYVHFKQNQGDDGEGLPAISLDLTPSTGKIDSFAQELRLSNGGDHPLRWVAGANYEKSKVYQDIFVRTQDSSTGYLFGGIGYPNFATLDYYSDQKMENYAFFGNVEYDLVDHVTLKGGIRYTQSNRDARLCSRDATGIPDGIGDFFYEVVYGGAFGAYPSGQCYVNNDQGVTINGVAPGTPGEYAGKLHQNNISWRVGADWKPQPELLLYANVARGYKAGSFPAVSASAFTQFLPVRQESVLTYEAGFKVDLFDRKAHLNGAAFYYDYKDKQLRSKLNAPPFGILDVLQNIPKSTVKGFELDASATPLTGLNISAAFTYIDAKIDRFVGINAAGVGADFAGARVPYTPKYQIAYNGDYTLPVSERLNAFVGTTVTYRSGTVAVIGGDIPPPVTRSALANPLLIHGYALVDLRAGVASADGQWRFMVFGKNVLNQYYWSNVVASFDTIGRYAGRPATYGASVSVRY
ncbi:TonB-dependent receptor [Rhizorhabdus histidinilytica]|uniref:TonB-dependent receptor n=1 Tax=Rhizorhabdus histidinilytica TaxID=439228 RepID=UPI001F38F416|nr:TonB-dependent receptor [Rhizorhabdus histidinilytica]